MIKFKVSAPGKIILYGDNLAMYERNVVAASLDLRTTLKFYELPNKESIIHLDLPDINLSLIVSLEFVLNFFFDNHVDVTDNIKLLKHVQYFITENGMWTTYEQRFSLQTFFFLFINMIHYEKLQTKSFYIYLTTQLPIGSGLGSSSSFAVCIAACFLQWGRLQKGDVGGFSDIHIEIISEYVKSCEEVVQNYVIQADNDVCSYGQVVRYYYDYKQKGVQILDVPKLNIILIDSRISKNKHEQMEQMATLNCNVNITNMLNKINDISNQACVWLTRINSILMNAYQLRYTFDILKVSFFLNCNF